MSYAVTNQSEGESTTKSEWLQLLTSVELYAIKYSFFCFDSSISALMTENRALDINGGFSHSLHFKRFL